MSNLGRSIKEYPIDMTFLRRLKVQLFGKVYLFNFQFSGYPKAVLLYAVNCKKHGIFLDTPHSFDEHFCCRACLAELKVKRSQEARL